MCSQIMSFVPDYKYAGGAYTQEAHLPDSPIEAYDSAEHPL
jgi:hypothetical protein